MTNANTFPQFDFRTLIFVPIMVIFIIILAVAANYGLDLSGTHAYDRHGDDAARALNWIENNKGPNSCKTCDHDGRYRCFVSMGAGWAIGVWSAAGDLITAFPTDDQGYVQDEREDCGFMRYAH